MSGSSIVVALKLVCALLAAMVIGNWFLSELKKSQQRKAPWYTPYISIPGILIIVAVLIPVFIWIFDIA